MTIKPLFDRVVIKEIAPETTKNGIFVGKTNQDNAKQGEVMFVGEGNIQNDGKNSPMFVKKGDKVLYSKFAGEEICIENKNYIIIRQTEILAILD